MDCWCMETSPDGVGAVEGCLTCDGTGKSPCWGCKVDVAERHEAACRRRGAIWKLRIVGALLVYGAAIWAGISVVSWLIARFGGQ